LLVFFDAERPVGIKVTAQVTSSELEDGLGDSFGPADSRTFHPILEKVLACTLDRAIGDGPALGQIFVITHAKAIAVEIVRDAAQRLTLGPEDPAFGHALANPLDNLTDFATRFARFAVQNPEFSLQASFGV
jgi:hypothetical protein